MRRAIFVLVLFLVSCGLCVTMAGAAPAFPQAPDGVYDGPGSVVYTKANAPAPPKLEELMLAGTVGQHGITWRFNRKARVGRFVTGDWYVVGPVTMVEITPRPLFGQEVVSSGK